jgi:tetratricopeptide (TPR) repeat protein
MNKLWCLFLCLPLSAADASFDKALAQTSRGDCAAPVETLSASSKSSADAGDESCSLPAFCQETPPQSAEAIRSARAALAKDPASPPLELALGKLLLRQNPDDPEAGALLARAAGAMPGNPEARHYYAQWAYLNDHDRVCIEQETAALRLPGLNDIALLQMNTLLGMCASRGDAIPEAKAAFEKALAVNARQAVFDAYSAYFYLQLLNRIGEDDAARRVTTQILSRAPTFAPALLEQAKQFDRAGQPEKAIEAAQAVLRAADNDINTQRAAHMILAKSYTILGNADEAKKEQMWIEQHPNPETRKNGKD